MANSTAMTTSFKQEVLSGGHCFNGVVGPTFTLASNAASVTAVSSMTGVAVGMAFSCSTTGVPANTVVARITSATALTLSALSTAAISGGTATIAGDVFFAALIGVGATGTYGTGSTNYSNLGTDEVTGTGYTSAGLVGGALTNVTATTGGNVAWITFTSNPSWTGATFSTTGCMIYNSSVRNGGTSGTNTTGGGRACSIHDFGGNQQVSSGTFTILLPSATSTTAILRIA